MTKLNCAHASNGWVLFSSFGTAPSLGTRGCEVRVPHISSTKDGQVIGHRGPQCFPGRQHTSEKGSRESTSSSSASPPRVIIWYISFRRRLMQLKPAMNSSRRLLRTSSCSRRTYHRDRQGLSPRELRACSSLSGERTLLNYSSSRQLFCYLEIAKLNHRRSRKCDTADKVCVTPGGMPVHLETAGPVRFCLLCTGIVPLSVQASCQVSP